jgi:putative MATE family efflux protein
LVQVFLSARPALLAGRAVRWLVAQTPAAGTLAAPGPGVDQGEIRRTVLRIAWPSILENLLQSVLGFVTVILVGQLGATEVAAAGASQQVQMLFISAFFALSMGATVIVAHAFGAGQHDGIGVAAKQSTMATILLSVVISIVVFVFARPMLVIMGADGDVVDKGARFQQISAVGFIFMAVMFVLGGALRGVGDTRTPMLVTLGINVVNVVLAVPLIFGGAGLPRLELDGAAIAQNVSRFIGCVVLGWLLYRGHHGVSIAGRDGWLPNGTFLRRLSDIAIPSMGESLLRSGGQFLFVIVVFQLGTAIAASHQIAQNAVFLSMFPGFGFSMAATALVGQSLGARNPERARAAAQTATRACIVWMSVMGVFFFIFAEPIMRLSASGEDKQQIIDAGVAALRVIAFAQPFQAIGFVLAGALRGAGDTRWPMVSTGLSMWLFRIPLAYAFAITFDLGLAGVYLAMGADNAILMALNVWRWRQGSWATRRLDTGLDRKPGAVPAAVPAANSAPVADPEVESAVVAGD